MVTLHTPPPPHSKRFSDAPVIMSVFIFNFVDTPRNFIIAKLSIRKPGSSSVLIKYKYNILKLNIIFFHHATFRINYECLLYENDAVYQRPETIFASETDLWLLLG